ncbi:hypothetical protein NQ318_023347 [Aromia moschata]|uniref:RNase H type-1 domain-containing protein n=1 Tax=Aromia moschata TaxID=1265417 RepID=A0AAV8XL32_9CUCU|nr:hypothetical protein NQ318_023347 [Aromia moschata]
MCIWSGERGTSDSGESNELDFTHTDSFLPLLVDRFIDYLLHHSVFQAEIYAILACGMEILKTAPKRRTIQICTDRQSALMAIESSKVKSRLVLDCKKILNDLASCNTVILTWVPGHSGVPGNEEADRLARLGSIGYPIAIGNQKSLNKEYRKIMARSPGTFMLAKGLQCGGDKMVHHHTKTK